MNKVLSLAGLRGESEEFKKRSREYNLGFDSVKSHERAMQINREWLAEKEKRGLNYTQLAKFYGVSTTNAVRRCKEALEERKKNEGQS